LAPREALQIGYNASGVALSQVRRGPLNLSSQGFTVVRGELGDGALFLILQSFAHSPYCIGEARQASRYCLFLLIRAAHHLLSQLVADLAGRLFSGIDSIAHGASYATRPCG
jgi:hypothetical protein